MIKKKCDCIVDVRNAVRGGKGQARFEHVWKQNEEIKANMRLFSRIILEPGCSIGYHVHENEDEIYVILKGRAEVDDNGVKKILEAGDSILTRNGEGHSITAIGDETLETLAVIGCYS